MKTFEYPQENWKLRPDVHLWHNYHGAKNSVRQKTRICKFSLCWLMKATILCHLSLSFSGWCRSLIILKTVKYFLYLNCNVTFGNQNRIRDMRYATASKRKCLTWKSFKKAFSSYPITPYIWFTFDQECHFNSSLNICLPIVQWLFHAFACFAWR